MRIEVIKLFTNEKNIQELDGGQGESFKVGNIVFKPAYEKEKYNWYSNELEKLDFNDIQYSKSVKSRNGNYIENSYCATSFIPGSFFEGKIQEKIQAANIFNNKIKNIQKPNGFYKWTNPWTKAQDVAWGVTTIPALAPQKIKDSIQELLQLKTNIKLEEQLVHCDFSGNILFNESGPVIIDFSPGFYPPEYSIACLIVDSVAWHNSTVDDFKYFEINGSMKYQLILRAVIFRLLVPFFFDNNNINAFTEEYQSFLPIIKWLEKEN